MATVRPFSAVHYRPERLPDPPVVLDEGDRWLAVAAARPPAEEPSPPASAAAAHVATLYRDWQGLQLARWLQEGLLTSYPHETLYVYRQSRPLPHHLRLEESLPERTSFVGLVGVLEPAGGAPVRPVELSDPDQVAATAQVWKAFAWELAPVVVLFSAKGREGQGLAELLRSVSAQPPYLELPGPGESVHQLWPLEPDACRQAQKLLESLPLAVVQGWERVAALEAGQGDGRPAGTLALLLPAQGQELAPVALSYHRVLTGPPGLTQGLLVQRASTFFRVVEPSPPHELPAALAQLGKLHGEFNGFVMYTAGGRIRLVRSKGRMFMESWTHPLGRAAWRSLDVNILHALLLERALGIPQAQSRLTRPPVVAEPEPRQAVQRVEQEGALAAFFLPAPSLELVWQAAVDVNPLPRASVLLWPPPAAGFVMRRRR